MRPLPRTRTRRAMVIVALVAAPALQAQGAEHAAYLARIHTPGGANAPVPMGPVDNPERIGWGVHVSVALVERPPTDFPGDDTAGDTHETIYGVGGDVPLGGSGGRGRHRLSASAGAITARCEQPIAGNPCAPGLQLGVAARGLLGSWEPDAARASRPIVAFGYSIDAGAGWQQTRAWAVGAGVPLMLSFRLNRKTWATETDPRFRPRTTIFVHPGVVHAELEAADRHHARTFPEFTVGVNVLDIGPGFGVTFAARTQVITGGRGVVGVALSWHRRK